MNEYELHGVIIRADDAAACIEAMNVVEHWRATADGQRCRCQWCEAERETRNRRKGIGR